MASEKAARLLKKFALLVILTASAPTYSQDDQVSRKYDKFEDKTIVKSALIEAGDVVISGVDLGKVYLQFGFQHAGKENKGKVSSLMVAVVILTLYGKYDLPGELIFLANDSERIKFEKLIPVSTEKGKDELKRDSYTVIMGGQVTYDLFMKIAFARTLEMRLDKFEYKLKPEHLVALRKLDAATIVKQQN
jgi:hypothetical protein